MERKAHVTVTNEGLSSVVMKVDDLEIDPDILNLALAVFISLLTDLNVLLFALYSMLCNIRIW